MIKGQSALLMGTMQLTESFSNWKSQQLFGLSNGEVKCPSLPLTTSVISSPSKCGRAVGGQHFVSFWSLHLPYIAFVLPIATIKYLTKVT